MCCVGSSPGFWYEHHCPVNRRRFRPSCVGRRGSKTWRFWICCKTTPSTASTSTRRPLYAHQVGLQGSWGSALLALMHVHLPEAITVSLQRSTPPSSAIVLSPLRCAAADELRRGMLIRWCPLNRRNTLPIQPQGHAFLQVLRHTSMYAHGVSFGSAQGEHVFHQNGTQASMHMHASCRRDGHNWRKKADGKTIRETHEKLKVGRWAGQSSMGSMPEGTARLHAENNAAHSNFEQQTQDICSRS